MKAKHNEGSVEKEQGFVLKILYFYLINTHLLCLKIFYINYEKPGIYSAVHHIRTQFQRYLLSTLCEWKRTIF